MRVRVGSWSCFFRERETRDAPCHRRPGRATRSDRRQAGPAPEPQRTDDRPAHAASLWSQGGRCLDCDKRDGDTVALTCFANIRVVHSGRLAHRRPHARLIPRPCAARRGLLLARGRRAVVAVATSSSSRALPRAPSAPLLLLRLLRAVAARRAWRRRRRRR